MPHIYLEYSDNVADRPEPKKLLRGLHDTLAGIESYNIRDIKSRLTVRRDYVVSDGGKNQSFVHLQLAIMPRPEALKKETSEKLLAYLMDTFPKTGNCSFSVEIRELEKASYSKSVRGEI